MHLPVALLNDMMGQTRRGEDYIRAQVARYFRIHARRRNLRTPAIRKGILLEQASLDLYNRVTGKNLTLCTESRHNDWLIGRCDVIDGDTIIDLKTCWSADTFRTRRYEWQLRGYMMLYDKPKACTVTVLIDTPPELIGDEDPAPHRVSHIPETERILVGNEVERDADKEQQIIERARYWLAQYQSKLQETKTMKDYSLKALNGHLHDQIERLMNPDLGEEELKRECVRGAAVAALARESIAIGDLYVRAAKNDSDTKIPMLEDK